MEKRKSRRLYIINRNTKCIKCGFIGSVKYFGDWVYDDLVIDGKIVIAGPHLSPAVGLGGIVPYECLNCGNSGMVDIGGLEGFKMAFKSIRDKNGSKEKDEYS